MAIDVTDETFETDVLARSDDEAVVIDLWAPWCGPCQSLGPIIERVVDETDGVSLAKVNVDENPRVSAAFQVQSIPAVYAVRNRAVVDGFVGALAETEVRAFVNGLVTVPSPADELVAKGDEASLRQALELEPGHVGGVTALAKVLVDRGDSAEALALLARIPETADTRHLAAQARLAETDADLVGDDARVVARLDELLVHVKDDESARQEFLDLLESMDDDDQRNRFRKALTARLF